MHTLRDKLRKRRNPHPPEFKKYPKKILKDSELLPYLHLMYNSLKKRELVVELRKPLYTQFEGQKIRAKIEENPLWYKEFCSQYIKNRGKYNGRKKKKRKEKFHDTKIKRKNTLNALENLIKNKYSYSIYFNDFIEIAKDLMYEEKKAEKLYNQGASLDEICLECELYMDLML